MYVSFYKILLVIFLLIVNKDRYMHNINVLRSRGICTATLLSEQLYMRKCRQEEPK